MKGLVIRSTGSFSTVKLEDGRQLECKIRGIFRHKGGLRTTNPVAVGDRVVIEEGQIGSPPSIVEIEARDNYIIRRSINLSKEAHVLAANVDQVYIVATINSPRTSFGFIDRLLVNCEAYHIRACILVNKVDMYADDDKALDALALLEDTYSSAGYEIILVSALTGFHVDELRSHMQGKICLFVGHSGVGKSSLINTIEPNLHIKTGDISDVHQKGKHTTTFAELHPLGNNTWIVDTPGVKEFGIVDMEKQEIREYFPEFLKLKSQCKFSNCQHLEEPNCAVRKAAEKGEISAERYSSYIGLMHSEELQSPKK